jgi:predicted glycoside hydrolase/deacetylase ChbG (UPF0249 family)
MPQLNAQLSTPTRRITLCADDYGLSPGVDAAIRDLLARGRLSATSVMVVTPTFDRGEALALTMLDMGARHAAIGLHVTLTAPHRPLTAGFRPLQGGTFPTLGRLMLLGLARRLDPAALAVEIRAQIAAFTAAFGRPPAFVDGHQHVQLLPRVSEAMLDAVKDLAPLAWVRQGGRAMPLGRRFADRKGLILDVLSRRFCRLAGDRGVAVNPAFAGTYDFNAPAAFAAVFPRFLDHLPDGGLVMCHPGTVDAELTRLDPLTTRREDEYAYFGSDGFAALLTREGVTLA